MATSLFAGSVAVPPRSPHPAAIPHIVMEARPRSSRKSVATGIGMTGENDSDGLTEWQEVGWI